MDEDSDEDLIETHQKLCLNDFYSQIFQFQGQSSDLLKVHLRNGNIEERVKRPYLYDRTGDLKHFELVPYNQ